MNGLDKTTRLGRIHCQQAGRQPQHQRVYIYYQFVNHKDYIGERRQKVLRGVAKKVIHRLIFVLEYLLVVGTIPGFYRSFTQLHRKFN